MKSSSREPRANQLHPADADAPAQPSASQLSRRALLKATGAALIGGAATLAGVPLPTAQGVRAATAPGSLRPRPNILIILTDQERYPRHWPAGWADANLPNRKRIADRGLSFTSAFCNTCMCSPSRSTLFSGAYPAQHGVIYTLTSGGSLSPNEPQLPLDIQNMARMLASAGYNVQYRGKWHMSKGSDGGKPTAADIVACGFNGWVEPDAGENTDPEGFGGGVANHDQAFAQQAAAFLATQTPAATADRPFALIVSFVNPHDVLAYPRTVGDDAVYTADTAKYNQGIQWTDIPSHNEPLATNNKPTAHAQTLQYLNLGLGVLAPPPASARRDYVNFYAYLQKVVDAHIGTVLDALEAQNLWDSTVVIRTADHGELGLAHGGLRQKMFNVYHEAINIPLTIGNPVLFPAAQTTSALASLVDVMPTLASLASVPNRDAWVFKGVDLSPLLQNPAATVQDAVLFTFDDQNAGSPNPQSIVRQPNHIRAIFDGRWKYARYFDPAGAESPQYELYDRQTDPDELQNLAGQNTAKQAEMASKLAALEADRLAPAALHKSYLPLVGG
ncbi:MAG: sulfatase-like hydrolase/transferase [Roseiflexaceae bacterium]